MTGVGRTDGATSTRHCPYCDLAFPTAEIRTLHLGRSHPDRLTDAETTRFERALDRESRRLWLLQLRALLGLVVLYFGLLFAYAVFA